MIHNRTLTQKANDFRIWRLGSSVDWDCNASEMAGELGLSSSTVSSACARRGWKLNNNWDRGGYENRSAADTLINSPFVAGLHE